MTQFYQLSGAERLAVELAEELNKRSIHADILSMYTDDLPGVTGTRQDLLDRGIPHVRFLGMKIHPSIVSMFPAILRLKRLIREKGYDIIETSMVSPMVLAALATRSTRARHVAGLHQVFRRDRENSKQHKFWRFSVRRNGHIRYYAISDYAKDCWIAYSKTSPSHTRTIYNAISEEYFNVETGRQSVNAELGIPEDERIVLYVGRLARYKGCDILLEALGPILEQEHIHLLYVGGPDYFQDYVQLIHDMQEKIKKERWDDRIHFLGFRNDASRLLSSADLLVHPTLTEGFGLVLAEAMAVGLPIVASNVEGIPEVLDGTDSIMVSPDNPAALREAVLKTMNRSKEEKTAAITLGRQQAEKFRTGKRADAMVSLFEDVLSGRF